MSEPRILLLDRLIRSLSPAQKRALRGETVPHRTLCALFRKGLVDGFFEEHERFIPTPLGLKAAARLHEMEVGGE